MGALAVMGGLSALGSLFGGIFGGQASSRAADAYQRALIGAQNFEQGQEKTATGYLSPWTTGGGTSATTLSNLLGTPGSGLLTPWTKTFTAPTEAEAENTPGYKFQLKAGEDAIQNSAAGKGSLLTGRTLGDLNNFAQGTASANYQNVFNNALTQYQSAYNDFRNNQNDQYQKLLGFSGQGLTGAGTSAGLTQQFGSDIASLMAKQGAVQAGGILGQANAYGSILPGLASSIGNMYTLSQLNGNGNFRTDTGPTN